MIAISVKQPWAYLICSGIKPIENRTWKLPEKYKGQRILIHASAKTDKEPYMLFNDAQIDAIGNDIMDVVASYHNTSAIIGSVVFSDCVINHPSIWAEKTQYIVELEKGVYLTSGQGDPPRTLLSEHAICFNTESEANKAISKARKYRPFINALVIANKPIYNWVVSDPILFDTPIPAKGKLGFWNYEGIECQDIICPNCHQVEHAIVDHRTSPFSTFIHTCRQCGYIIMESEWDKVKLKTNQI